MLFIIIFVPNFNLNNIKQNINLFMYYVTLQEASSIFELKNKLFTPTTHKTLSIFEFEKQIFYNNTSQALSISEFKNQLSQCFLRVSF